MSLSPTDLGRAAYDTYRYRLRRGLARKGNGAHIKTWNELSPLVQECWIQAAVEVVSLTRPGHEVLREAAMRGMISLRVADEDGGKKS